MAQLVRDVMSQNVVTLPRSAALVDAARRMREADIGDVIVMNEDSMCGVVTDRDIVVRAIADGKDPGTTALEEVCSHEVVTVAPDDSIDRAAELMRERAVRRLPVTEDARPIGIVSLADLAIEREDDGPLPEISAASSNN